MRSNQFFHLCLIGIIFFVMSAGVFAQSDQDVSAEAQGTVEAAPKEQRLKVAVSELDISSGPDGELQVEYDKTMRYDLDFSDFFAPVPNSPQMSAQHTKDQQLRAIDYRAWQKLGAEVLVKGEFEDLGSSGNIRFYAYDVYDEIPLMALEYPLKYNSREKKIREVRRSIHNFVDGIVQKYDPNGLPGCAHSYIAYENAQMVTERSGKKKAVREIFIMDYDGRNVRQITQDGNLALSPSWSPDGRKLVYTSYRQGNPDLYIYDLDSGTIRVLAAFPGMNSAASWSPDGRSLALTLSRDGNPEVYIIGADGSNARRLTRSKSVETSPTFTPDGRAIIFISDRYGAPQILGVSVSGGEPWVLTRTGHNDDPCINPRGDSMIFTSNRGGGGFNVWISDMQGGNARNLTWDLKGNCEHPTWAPDGRHIVFSHSGRLVVMDADGTDKRVLSTQAGISGEQHAPAWGP